MDKNIDDLKHIRSMMERSTKFLSVSGLAGIGAGAVALLGAYTAQLLIKGKIAITNNLSIDLLILATTVLMAAACCGLYFSLRKARRSNMKFWMPVTTQILKDFFVPMIVGGLFCLAMVINDSRVFVAPTMLIFYGLALLAAGSRTYRDIKMLGTCEIILGLIAAVFTHKGLLFWALGFGVLHIVYGIALYYKYDRKTDKESAA